MTTKKLVLLDGSSMAFRAFYGLQDLHRFKNKNGLHTNALYAFHKMIEGVLTREQPTHILVAFDAGKATFRTEKYADYKGGRASMPEELQEQWPFFPVMLDAFGIQHYELPQYEADDIIGTLARQASEAAYDVVIVTGDRDMTQLVSERVRVDITVRQGIESHTPASMLAQFGITPKQMIDVKGLMGDSSDNYPGVRKVGEKTALKLIQEHQSIEQLYAVVDTLKTGKLKENLIQDKAMAYLSKELATIDEYAPVAVTLNDLVFQGGNPEALRAFYQEMDFKQFLSQLEEETVQVTPTTDETVDYTVVSEIDEAMLTGTITLHIEHLEENYHLAEPIALAWGTEHGAYYLCAWDVAVQSSVLKQWLADSSREKIVYDVKRMRVLLKRYGLALDGVIWDILLAAYVVNAQTNAQDIADLAATYELPALAHDTDVYGKGAKQAVPADDAHYPFIVQKIRSLQQLVSPLEQGLLANDQMALYRTLELPLANVLADMENTGIVVNAETLREMGADFQQRLTAIEQRIYEQVGETFNLNSPKQLGVILFEKLGLPVIKKTKTGYSTAADVLEKLERHSPIVADILHYRQLAKLNSTYIDGLLESIQADGRIHTRYVQTLTQTGRLSSVDPNLQNIPIRMEEGRRIRRAFEASDGQRCLMAFDYSQIELRVLAHISGDQHLQEAFIADKDIHTSTAARVFGVPEADVTSAQRRQAKAVNFGIVYGISDYGLSQNLNITRKAAQQYIDTYFEKYPGIKQYMHDIVQTARQQGYVETLYNRRRYLPDISAKNFNLRSFAERTAMNTPIQGTAADIIKVAMLRIAEQLKQEQLQSTMLLQVHDELIFDVVMSEQSRVRQLVVDAMEHAATLSVPLKVDGGSGKTWYDAK